MHSHYNIPEHDRDEKFTPDIRVEYNIEWLQPQNNLLYRNFHLPCLSPIKHFFHIDLVDHSLWNK